MSFVSLSNYQFPRLDIVTTFRRIIPKIYTYPKISEKAIKYLKKKKISVEEFLDFIRLITVSEGALMRTYSGINITEPIGVYVDLFEWDECVEFDECPKKHIIRSISIQIDFPKKTIDEIVDSIFKLNGLLYKAYPNLDAHFIYQSYEQGDKK
ncbi:MAG: hypothetical protein RXR31_02785 [Thermoproteota archaeon]